MKLQADAPRKTCSPEFVHTQLEKILSSAGFARNELSGFLRFVVEQELSGRGDELTWFPSSETVSVTQRKNHRTPTVTSLLGRPR
jgi:hypothetical protein